MDRNDQQPDGAEPRVVAEAARAACLRAAIAAWDDAGWAGLCAEGRWEQVLDAIRTVDLNRLVADAGECDAADGA